MEKFPMCRICLAEDVRMYVVVNKSLHELYEKLTDVPFVTKDSRPMLACFFCCTKLKQCWRFLKKCLEAEKLFAEMMDGDYELNLLINQDQEHFNGFIKTPVENISIIDAGPIEGIPVKEEFVQAVCEKQMFNIQPKEGYIINIEPKVEHLSDEPEPDNVFCRYPEVEDIAENHLDSDLGYVPLITIKAEVGEVSRKEHRATDTKQAAVAKKPKLNTRRLKLEDVTIDVQKKNEQSEMIVFHTTQNRTRKRVTNSDVVRCNNNNIANNKREGHIRLHIGDKRYKCGTCQSSFKKMAHLTRHILRHTGEKPHKCDICQRTFSQLCNLNRHIRTHNGEKPFKCDLCQCSFNDKRDLSKHIWDHTGIKPFKCEICLERFSDKRVLIKHMRKHTGKMPLRCEICQRNFCYSSDLEKHIRIHTGEKPYKCEICQRGFNVKGNLKKHLITHTGEKQL